MVELGTSFYNQRISSKDFVVLNLGHATWASFSLLRDEKMLFFFALFQTRVKGIISVVEIGLFIYINYWGK